MPLPPEAEGVVEREGWEVREGEEDREEVEAALTEAKAEAVELGVPVGLRADPLREGVDEGTGPRLAVPVPPPPTPPAVPLAVEVERGLEVGVPPEVTEDREVDDTVEVGERVMAEVLVELPAPPKEGEGKEEEDALEVGKEEGDLKGEEEGVSLPELFAVREGVEVKVPTPPRLVPVGVGVG